MRRDKEVKILIVGAGFGGISAALHLHHRHLKYVRITIMNPIPHFEYHAMLYRVLTGKSPTEACIPLIDIFARTSVETVEDSVISIDFEKNKAKGTSGSTYHYDYLVLATGSQTAYYDISGLKDNSYSLKTTSDAIRLKRHIHEQLNACIRSSDEEKKCHMHTVVVGGGPTGVEVSAELILYMNHLAKEHSLDTADVEVDLITSSDRLLPQLPEIVSRQAYERLKKLGVRVYLKKKVMKDDVLQLVLNDMKIQSHTIIWAAGTEGNSLYRQLDVPRDGKQRIAVNEYLQPYEKKNVFIVGDAASTPYSGMAGTAMHDGIYVADQIGQLVQGAKLEEYHPEKIQYCLPVGQNWAMVQLGVFHFSGRIGWWMKRFRDFQFFLSILPVLKAVTVFRDDGVLWEECPVCGNQQSG